MTLQGVSQQELIYVERRDLGVSGTKGQEEREGLADLIQLIEQGKVESVYVIEISRPRLLTQKLSGPFKRNAVGKEFAARSSTILCRWRDSCIAPITNHPSE